MSLYALHIPSGSVGAFHDATSASFSNFLPQIPLFLSFELVVTRTSGTATATLHVEIDWKDSAGTSLTPFTSDIIIDATSQALKKFQVTPPANAASGTCYLKVTPAASPMIHDVQIENLRLGKTELAATMGADWSGNVLNRPANLSVLTGGEALKNSLLAMNGSGQLTYDGTTTVSTKKLDNALVSIGANGAMVGGGGGQVTIGGLGYTGDLNATLGAAWGTTLTGRPANLSSLTGSEALKNALLAMNGLGQLTYDGTTTVSASKLDNALVSIGANGAMVGGGGGQVTIGGLGYTGDLNATLGAAWGTNLTGRPANLSSLTGSEALKNALLAMNASGQLTYDGTSTVSTKKLDNALVSIGANGAMIGGGGGQVTAVGLALDPGAMSADNTLRNSFMTDATGDAWWSPLTRTAGSVAGDPLWYARATAFAQQGSFNSGQGIPVLGGDTIYVSGRARLVTASAANFIVRFSWKDATGASVAGATDASITPTTTSWATYTASIVAPATAAFATVAILVGNLVGGTADIALPRAGRTQLMATVGATWGTNIVGRPSNLSALAGSEAINNASLTINGSGQLTRDGTNVVSSLTLPNTFIAITGVTISGIGTGSGTSVNNAGVSIGANGALGGGGGGQVTIGGLTPNGLDDVADGVNFSRISSSRVNASRPLIDFSEAIHRNQLLTYIADDASFAKVAASQTTGNVLKLAIAGSGAKIGDQRNLPPIATANLRYKFTGFISYSATTTSATINVGAGSILLGSTSISLNAMSVVVSGAAGDTHEYQLYIVNPNYAGGSFTLIATTTGNDVYSDDNRMWLGSIQITFPTSGTGSGNGGSGGGGGLAFTGTGGAGQIP